MRVGAPAKSRSQHIPALEMGVYAIGRLEFAGFSPTKTKPSAST